MTSLKYLCLVFLLWPPVITGQTSDTSIVKYFPTRLTRGVILKEAVEPAQVQGQAHFRATYTRDGRLSGVEYVPAPGDASDRTLVPPAEKLQYFGEWNAHKRRLADPLTRAQCQGRPCYAAAFDSRGLIRRVEVLSSTGRLLWSYHLHWNQAATRSTFEVEFHVNRPLTRLERTLFVPALSEMKPGWVARFGSLPDGRPSRVEVYDDLDQLYYFYHFQYRRDGPVEIIESRYFRADSTLLGRHSCYFRDTPRPFKIEYYSPAGLLQKVEEYTYDLSGGGVQMTARDGQGRLLEKRWWRKPPVD